MLYTYDDTLLLFVTVIKYLSVQVNAFAFIAKWLKKQIPVGNEPTTLNNSRPQIILALKLY